MDNNFSTDWCEGTVGGMKVGTAAMENSMEVPQKTNNRATI